MNMNQRKMHTVNNNDTLRFYESNAKEYSDSTKELIMTTNQDIFLGYIPKDGIILDFGCGSGRDSKYFLSKGYKVEAVDGSKNMCVEAEKNTGLKVKNMLFSELNEKERYDGIWACASILHANKNELPSILDKMITATKKNGFIFTCFKYGEGENDVEGRHFNYFTEDSFLDFMKEIKGVSVLKTWITNDVRKDRPNLLWLNIILKKQ